MFLKENRKKRITPKTTINGNVLRKNLPKPPQGYKWKKVSKEGYRYKVYYNLQPSRKNQKYIYKTFLLSKPVRKNQKYYYIRRKGKRKRVYPLRKRVYLTRKRIPYKISVWVLEKIQGLPKGKWIKVDDYLDEVCAKIGIDREDLLESDAPIYHDWIEVKTKFNFWRKNFPPLDFLYDLMFIHYIQRVGKESPKVGDVDKYILRYKSFGLPKDYNVESITNDWFPKGVTALKKTFKRLKAEGKHITLIRIVAFSVAKLSEQEDKISIRTV